jgi:hypothetical protein
MNRFILAVLAGATLLCGCASTDGAAPAGERAERGSTSIGSFIPRKSGNGPANVATADKQAIENERQMSSSNVPTR